MRRRATWGLVVLIIGVVLLLDNLGYLNFLGVGAWQLLWPTALVALGIWILFGAKTLRYKGDTEDVAIGLQGETTAKVQLEYGAGELHVAHGAQPGQVLSGSFEGGLDQKVQRSEAAVDVRLSSPLAIFPPVVFWPPNWGLGARRRWDIHLSDAIGFELTVKTGASDCHLDLERLKVTRLRFESGASSSVVTLPARAGYTEVRGSSGAASVSFRIPEGVAARIRAQGGLSSTTIDRQRFPRQGGVYVSPDYETAENRVDIRFDIGVGSIDIR